MGINNYNTNTMIHSQFGIPPCKSSRVTSSSYLQSKINAMKDIKLQIEMLIPTKMVTDKEAQKILDFCKSHNIGFILPKTEPTERLLDPPKCFIGPDGAKRQTQSDWRKNG